MGRVETDKGIVFIRPSPRHLAFTQYFIFSTLKHLLKQRLGTSVLKFSFSFLFNISEETFEGLYKFSEKCISNRSIECQNRQLFSVKVCFIGLSIISDSMILLSRLDRKTGRLSPPSFSSISFVNWPKCCCFPSAEYSFAFNASLRKVDQSEMKLLRWPRFLKKLEECCQGPQTHICIKHRNIIVTKQRRFVRCVWDFEAKLDFIALLHGPSNFNRQVLPKVCLPTYSEFA